MLSIEDRQESGNGGLGGKSVRVGERTWLAKPGLGSRTPSTPGN
ncbi:hypothetical protein NW836_08580 [Synechococcus sp. H60.4]